MGGPGMGELRQDQKWIALLEVYGKVSDADARALTDAVHKVLDKFKKNRKVKGFNIKFNAVGTKTNEDP